MKRARTLGVVAAGLAPGFALATMAATAWADAPPAAAPAAPPASASPAKAPAKAPAPANAPTASSAAPAPEPPPRPAALPLLDVDHVPWERHLEIGGDVVLGTRLASHDAAGASSDIRYKTAVGWGLHARWPVWKYARFSIYFADLHHALRLPPGSLGQPGATYELDKVETFVFGAKIGPTLPLSDRLRIWASVGAGWGRFQFPRSKMTLAGASTPATLYEQAFSFVEIPIGLGASFDVVPRWLSIELEVTGAALSGQRGEALDGRQVIDPGGHVQHTTGFPTVDASFTETLGFSLLL
jgi:hypothetical protein